MSIFEMAIITKLIDTGQLHCVVYKQQIFRSLLLSLYILKFTYLSKIYMYLKKEYIN